MLTYRYTSRIETINLIKELHPHCQNKKKQNKYELDRTLKLTSQQKSQKTLGSQKQKHKTEKKPKGEAINTKHISQGYDISLLKLKLNDEYHTISEIK